MYVGMDVPKSNDQMGLAPPEGTCIKHAVSYFITRRKWCFTTTPNYGSSCFYTRNSLCSLSSMLS